MIIKESTMVRNSAQTTTLNKETRMKRLIYLYYLLFQTLTGQKSVRDCFRNPVKMDKELTALL